MRLDFMIQILRSVLSYSRNTYILNNNIQLQMKGNRWLRVLMSTENDEFIDLS